MGNDGTCESTDESVDVRIIMGAEGMGCGVLRQIVASLSGARGAGGRSCSLLEIGSPGAVEGAGAASAVGAGDGVGIEVS